MNKITLVTGGAGFLGRHLVQSLLNDGRRVLVLDKDILDPMPSLVDAIEMDLTAYTLFFGFDHPGNFLSRSVRESQGLQIEEIYHFASPASPPLYKQRRRETLRLGGHVLDQLLALAEESGARLCFASSSEVYGDPPANRIPTPETFAGLAHSIGPRSCYDEAKRYGEALCDAWHHEAGLDARIVRIHNTYGPGMPASDGRLMARLVWAAIHGLPFQVHGDGRQTRCFSYVDDTIAAIRTVMDNEQPVVPVNVGDDHETSILELITHVELALGLNVRVEHVDRQDIHDPGRRRPSLDRLRSLGWQPMIPLYEGIRRTAAWMATRTETGELISG